MDRPTIADVPLQDETNVTRMTQSPLCIADCSLYKTLLYCAVSAPVLFAERVWDAYRETGAFGEAVLEAWTHTDRNVVWAKVIIIGLVVACYHLYQGIDRRLGQDKLWRMILSRE